MVCKVKMGTYPNFTQGVQWTISGNGDHGMKYNDAVESWEITGCENSSVVFYEHGDHNRGQQANVLTNGKYQKYNAAQWINSHGPYASDIYGVSAAKIQSPGGESLVNGGKINATIDIPDGKGPLGGGDKHVMHANWINYLKPNQDHGLSEHCPGATWKAWQHAKTADKPAKALCQWKITENNMSSLAASNETHVKGAYNTIINRVCNAIKNDTPNFKTGKGNETCWDLVKTQDYMRDYCFKEGKNRMSEDPLCSKSSLGNSYEILAKEYCENNPDKEFCACYNVAQPGLCEQVPNLPGCKTVKPIWDKITSSLDEGDIAQFEGMQPCYGSVCAGNVYQPTGWDTNCNKDISICKADFDIGGDLVGSNITVKQNCGNDSGDGDGDGSGSTTTTNDQEKSLTEKLFKFEEDKDKKLTEKRSTKIFGTVSSVSSCFMCMTALVLFT
jgi:hypothetical protein